MKTKLYLLIISVIVANNIQAQSFGRALLEGLARGVENAAQIQRQQLQQLQQQNSNNASSVYQQSKSALNNSSFSLQNTYATNVNKTINFSDGRVFKGIIHDDSYIGDLYYADGTHCKGTFDSNLKKQGLCTITYPNGGGWYYGYFKDGEEDGEGSICVDGEYYDVNFSKGELISSAKVVSGTPKFDKEGNDALNAAIVAESIRQMQEYDINTNSSSSGQRKSSSSNRSSRKYSTSQINRQADVTAKAYEAFKKDPSIVGGLYYHSQQNRLKNMQKR